ncbi:Hsp20/alpha crystallin family protein [Haloechinothrix sp. LS1_15]|uniref:Hsp20/alpha crystallin family protein n=1 Tax=Haloechinothrix sp. LS1_15 TaxID=2652248 RepID=UPI0029448527|nr:Hsp20/alpha crystallin family protein [Haloechinothrix sp. LS1_15]MDV6014240.1 hypothetical protein [Haloechinothrix sp. LS1_15]
MVDHSLRVEEYLADGVYLIHVAVPDSGDPRDVNLSIVSGRLYVAVRDRHAVRGVLDRAIPLPPSADTSGVTARYAAGIVEVRVPIVARVSA